jgi:hypothetical protein
VRYRIPGDGSPGERVPPIRSSRVSTLMQPAKVRTFSAVESGGVQRNLRNPSTQSIG